MVAEALPETEQTPPEDVALTTPESAPESAPPPETNEEDAALDAILESFGSDDTETDAGDGKGAATDGLVPPPEKALTPEEIREDERRKVAAQSEANTNAANLRAYREGVTRSFQSVESELTAKAKDWGLDLEQADWLRQRFSNHNGHWNVLYQAALEQASPQIKGQAYQEAEAEVSKLLLTTVSEELGDTALKAIQTAAPKTWPDLAKAITREARKGYVAKEEVSKAQRKVLGRIDEALKGRGMTLAQITGSTGPNTPAARGGSAGMTRAAFEDLSIDEQLKVPAAERARIYGSTPQR